MRVYVCGCVLPWCVMHPPRAVNVFLYKIGSSGSSTSRRTTLALRMKPDLQKYGARVFRVFGTFSPLSRSTSRSTSLAYPVILSLPLVPLSRSVSVSHIQTYAYRRAFSRYLILPRKLARLLSCTMQSHALIFIPKGSRTKVQPIRPLREGETVIPLPWIYPGRVTRS